MSSDGALAFNARFARFPAAGAADLWVGIRAGEAQYAVVEDLPIGDAAGATDVASSVADFILTGTDPAWFLRRGSPAEAFTGHALVMAGAHPGGEPERGRGPLRVGFHARFVADHVPVAARPGRIEVFGRVAAVVDLPDGPVEVRGLGKWHEQVGPRPKFGARFTYMNLQNERASLLARRGLDGSWGFAAIDGQVVGLRSFEIEPLADRRTFEVTLADGRVIRGEARTRWTSTVPVDGHYRPGAFVDADCSLGPMMGRLNDWDPDGNDTQH
jgi:hypothetical protein